MKNKKGDLLANVFLVIITLIVFFALYPAAKVLIDLAIGINAGEDAGVDLLIGSVFYVMLFGMLKWIYNSVGGGGSE